jgi:hypothetical protein
MNVHDNHIDTRTHQKLEYLSHGFVPVARDLHGSPGHVQEAGKDLLVIG